MKPAILPQLLELPRSAWIKLLLGLATAIGSLYLLAQIIDEILEHESQLWDQRIYGWLHYGDSESRYQLMLWITHSGAAWCMIFLSLAVIAWLYFGRHNLHAIKLFLIANLGGLLLNFLLKVILRRERPLIDPEIYAVGYSLPSGHAMAAMIFYGFIGYLLIRSQRSTLLKGLLSLVLLLFIGLIGISRIYLNAHYASDVAAGFFAGSFWLSACILALEARPWYRRHFIKEVPGELPGDHSLHQAEEQRLHQQT